MKKMFVLLLIISMVCSVTGCSLSEDIMSAVQPKQKTFQLEEYGLQIIADDSFSEKTGGSFDLQITNDKAYISIMAYTYEDLPQDTTVLDVLDVQNEDLMGKRDNVAVVQERKTQSVADGEIIYEVYSAEKDGVKNYYATYLVDFPEAEVCAWVLVTATPSYYNNQTEYLHNIVCSMTPVL